MNSVPHASRPHGSDPGDVDALVGDLMGRRVDRRQFLARAAGLGLAAPAAAALLAACGSSSPSSSATSTGSKPKTLLWRGSTDMKNVDPANDLPGAEDGPLETCFFEGLIANRPGTGAAVHCLAESLETSKDGLQIHFTLKQGIPWQKGYGEVTANDVKYSYERIAGLTKPKLNAPAQGEWSALDSVRVDGKHQGTILLKEVFAPVMTSTLRGVGGYVVPEKAVEKLGKSFGTDPVGSGPFQFESWVPGQKVVLKRFPQYGGANKAYANKQLLDEIVMQPISSDTSAYAALQTGSINYCELGVTTVKQALANTNLKVTRYSYGSYYWLAMNVTQPPLTNIWLRRAVRSAVDVPAVIKVAYDGLYTRTNAIIPKTEPIGYWPSAPQYNQDIPLAKSYLRKSGLGNVTLTLAAQNDQTDLSAAQLMAADIEKVGIKVNVKPVDPATFEDIPGVGGGGPHAELVYSWYAGALDPHEWFEWWTCAQMKQWNWDHWCNQEFTKLTNDALHTFDTAKRTSFYIEAQKLWDQACGMVWICNGQNYLATTHDLVVSVDPVGDTFLPWNTTYA